MPSFLAKLHLKRATLDSFLIQFGSLHVWWTGEQYT